MWFEGAKAMPGKRPSLSLEAILAWADEYRRRVGKWPSQRSGAVPAANGELWANIDRALAAGLRGLPGGSSLAKLLASRRGRRNPKDLPRLTEKQILAWADAHRDRTGRWPTTAAGPVLDARGENWRAINGALYCGFRSLPGGDSLARLLVRNRRRKGPVMGRPRK
jgi:hypothetical protein